MSAIETLPQRTALVKDAVRLWSDLSGRAVDPTSVEALKEKKASVYVLRGAGPAGCDVVVKHGDAKRLAAEVVVYGDVLPRLPTRTLQLFASVPDGSEVWLFMERASRDRMANTSEDRALLGRWLAALHLATADQDSHLPEHGLSRYHGHLQATRSAIAASADNLAIDQPGRRALTLVDDALGRAEGRWTVLEGACADTPSVLVHGDLVAKNIHVWDRAGRPELSPLDWETSGRGAPAPDLSSSRNEKLSARPDLRAYLREASDLYPRWDESRLARLATAGSALRALAAMDWASRRLKYEWVDRPLRDLPVFASVLSVSITELSASSRQAVWHG